MRCVMDNESTQAQAIQPRGRGVTSLTPSFYTYLPRDGRFTLDQ